MAKHIAAGTTLAFFGFVDSLGFLTGESTSAPAVNVLSPMRRLLGIQSASPGVPEGDDVNIEGDDETLGTISFPPNTTPAFVANFGAFDLATAAAMQATLTKAYGNILMGVIQPNDPGQPNGTLIIQGKAVSKDDADSGLSIWEGIILPLVTAQYLGRESFEGRTAAVNRIKFTAQKAGHQPTGVTISEADFATTGASIIEFESKDGPVLMDRYTGNGAATSVTLTKAVANVNSVLAFVNTQQLAHGSGITATADSRTLTFDSAPASNAKVVIMYAFVP
jgi:hypothetical protein